MTEWKECKIADLGTVIGGAPLRQRIPPTMKMERLRG